MANWEKDAQVTPQGLVVPKKGLTPKEVSDYQKAHVNADTDFDSSAIHHTLGTGPFQAASGSHLHDGRYALKATSTNYATLNPNITGAADLYRDNNTIHCVFVLGSPNVMPGGTVFATMPPNWRPGWINVNNRYGEGVRGSTGLQEPFFYDYLGRIVNVFSIPAGDSFYGNFSFVVVA